MSLPSLLLKRQLLKGVHVNGIILRNLSVRHPLICCLPQQRHFAIEIKHVFNPAKLKQIEPVANLPTAVAQSEKEYEQLEEAIDEALEMEREWRYGNTIEQLEVRARNYFEHFARFTFTATIIGSIIYVLFFDMTGKRTLEEQDADKMIVDALARERERAGFAASVVGSLVPTVHAAPLKKGEEGGRNPFDSPMSRDELLRRVDKLYTLYLIDNLYNIMRRHRNSSDAEFLWRLARASCEKSKLSKDKKDKRDFMEEAMTYIQKAYDTEDGQKLFAVHKWYGIVLNYMSEFEGTKGQLKKAPEVRKHLERALEIDETDATTWHILGVWHFTFADLPGYQRTVASVVFGSPPTSTYEQALECFEKAEKMQPGFYSKNLLYLSHCYQRLGDREKHQQFLRLAYQYPVLSADDLAVHDEAFKTLKRLGVDVEKLVEAPKPVVRQDPSKK